MAAAQPPGGPLAPKVCDAPGARQDRRSCCGTMNLPEYHRIDRALDGEAQALARWCAANGRLGECVLPEAAMGTTLGRHIVPVAAMADPAAADGA
jgi:hypothetical protein